MQRPELDAADGVVEAVDIGLGLDILPARTVEVPADEPEMLLELVEVLPQP